MPRRLTPAALALSLALGVALGALAGVAWEWWWTPPPGIFLGGTFYLDENGLPAEFSGTGWFVVAGGLAGVLVGVVHAWWWRGAEVVGTVLALVSGLLVTGLAWQVGTRLGPADPDVGAADVADYTTGVLDLRVAAWPAYLAPTAGVCLGLLAVFAVTHLLSRSGREDRTPADMIRS